MTEIPAVLNWVEAEHKCSASLEFIALRMQAEKDVEQRNGLGNSASIDKVIFRFKAISDDRFAVARDIDDNTGITSTAVIYFQLRGKRIMVQNGQQQTLLDMRVGLSVTGQCVFKDDRRELYQWQLLHEALNSLFFETIK